MQISKMRKKTGTCPAFTNGFFFFKVQNEFFSALIFHEHDDFTSLNPPSACLFCSHFSFQLPRTYFLAEERCSEMLSVTDGGVPFLSPGRLLDPGMAPGSLTLQTDSFLYQPPGKPVIAHRIV